MKRKTLYPAKNRPTPKPETLTLAMLERVGKELRASLIEYLAWCNEKPEERIHLIS